MICRNCLRAAARGRTHQPAPSQSSRFISSSTARRNAAPVNTTATSPAPRQDSGSPSHSRPAATSTSAAQPFSEPLTPSAKPEKPKQTPIVKSSVPAGTPLKGLNFLKNKEDPIAMADDEYPSWLWDILKSQEKKGEAAAEGDLFSKSKKQRRLAAKRLRKEQLANPSLLHPKVPIYEQTIDLPAGDGTAQGAIQAAEARGELTQALRNKRRANIKEANFLKAMG
ncbi:mitochondrial ribosomal protein L37-domain-containing protein [Lophiotrema nucula]|uniref:Large ribosomal subunit protein mL54 n=1 Tax=Lophiotrema nucula TaxID=690887 RepID=A0A6A5ZGW9_9PLEO|nr:mitochondrial ribosomal protein L37-domain-containing protein [Lophiotrema nucula]